MVCIVGFCIQLVAVFDEIYGRIHFIVSVATFLTMALAGVTYCVETGEKWPLPLIVFGVAAWAAFFRGLVSCGVAVPEMVSIAISSSWYVRMLYLAARHP